MAIHYIDDMVAQYNILKFMIQEISENKYIGIDTETTGLDPFTCQVLLIQLKVGNNVYVLNRGKLGLPLVTKLIKHIEDSGVICIGHNIKFDMKMIMVDTGIMLTHVYDTMVIEAVLTAGLGGKFCSLKELVEKYTGVILDKDTRLDFVGLTRESIFTEQQITYSAVDVLYLDDIYNKQIEESNKVGLTKIVNLECSVEPTVAQMEISGIELDVPYWNKLTDLARKEAVTLKAKLIDVLFEAIPTKKYGNAFEFSQAVSIPVKTKRLTAELEGIINPISAIGWIKENFNINSPKQLTSCLNLAGIKTTSTDEKILNKLPKNLIIDTLLEYRGYEKMISTYGDNFVASVNPVTKRIHADFNQVGTASGRFSSSGGINMQNIPTHNGYREGFVAKEGYSFVASDFSQQEYRLAGAISKEPKIIEAYVNGFDMHTATAALRFGKDMKDVTKEERNKGKGTNFTILYGGTEYALGKNLNMTQDESIKLLQQFLANYPVLAAHKEASENMIVKLGYSVTLMGRRRYWKPLGAFSTPREVDTFTNKMKREGYNHIIQGTGADVTKLSMINITKNNPFGHDKFHLILQIHDELVAEVSDDIIDDAIAFIKYEMESAFQPFLGSIPALVDTKSSKRWTKG